MSLLFKLARKNPERFIGKALHEPGYMRHFLFHSLRFPLDDFSKGYCKKLLVILTEDNFVSVENDGLSIPATTISDWPVERILPGTSNSPEGATYLELSMSTLHFVSHDAYLKYFKKGPCRDGYFPINVFSSECRVTIWKDGHEWSQNYISGLPTDGIRQVGPTTKSGMCFSFRPYRSIEPFDSTFNGLEFSEVCNWLRSTPDIYMRNRELTADIPVTVIDQKMNQSQTITVKWEKNINSGV